MSAICGVFECDWKHSGEPDKRSAEPLFPVGALEAMMPSLARFGSDGSAIWHRGAVGFGHQMMHVTPESLHERLPWHDPAAAMTITAQARLDNRAELCEAFSIPQPERCRWPDSRLILQAYQKWGTDCPTHLLGDFAFAIWDERQRRLFGCRDHTGVYPFFYRYDGRRFVFASRIAALLAVPGIDRRLNYGRVAALASNAARFQLHEQTFFAGILSLPSGTSLLVEEEGLRLQTYWRPEDARSVRFRRDVEVLEALQALLSEAVSARLRSAFPVAAMLSGGLDSSALVSLAARSLQQRGESLLTFSSVLPEQHAPGLADERAYIDQFRGWPNLIRHYISAPGSGPFDEVESIVRDYESPILSSAHFLYTAFAQAVRQTGARVVLDGVNGEQGPSDYGHEHYADLLLKLRWHTLWRELSQRSRNEGCPRRELFRSLVMPWLIPPVCRPRRPAPAILQPEFLRQHLVRQPPGADETRSWHWPDQRRSQLRAITNLCLKHSRGGDGLFVGQAPIIFGLPYRDKRLLEFCLGVPGDLKVRNGYSRYLLRAGLDGLLPPEIQWRTTKGPFSPDYYERYRAQRHLAQSYLNAVAPHDPVREVVAVETLKRLAASDDRMANLDLVPSGIYLLCFLRQFAEFQG